MSIHIHIWIYISISSSTLMALEWYNLLQLVHNCYVTFYIATSRWKITNVATWYLTRGNARVYFRHAFQLCVDCSTNIESAQWVLRSDNDRFRDRSSLCNYAIISQHVIRKVTDLSQTSPRYKYKRQRPANAKQTKTRINTIQHKTWHDL